MEPDNTLKPDNLPGLETTCYQIDPLRLSKLRKNARYMTGDQIKRLTANIEHDGALTSVPLVYNVEGTPDGTLLVLSGNHRVEAAIKAKQPQIWVMEVLTRIDEQRQVALQLSHNAITGQDDPSILFELYQPLDLDAKRYSGLTDDSFKLPPLDVAGLSISAPEYQEVAILFLPAEAEAFKRQLATLAKRRANQTVMMADYADFDKFFETVVRAKKTCQIFNTATVMRHLVDLANERLDQIEAEGKPEDAPERADD